MRLGHWQNNLGPGFLFLSTWELRIFSPVTESCFNEKKESEVHREYLGFAILLSFRLGVGNLQLVGQIWLITCLGTACKLGINFTYLYNWGKAKKNNNAYESEISVPINRFYQNTVMPIYVHSVYGYICATTTDLNSGNRDHVTWKPKKQFNVWPFTVCLLTLR